MATLIKIDRNGSKHFEGYRACGRCGGSGFVPYTVDNGVCWECMGSGKTYQKWIERTPEYEAVLDERRQARQEARANAIKEQLEADFPQNKAKNLAHEGFNENGTTWVFLGNTYPIKDTLKEMGAKFDLVLGWHIDHEVEGYNCIKVNADDYYDFNEYAQMNPKDGADVSIKSLKAEANRQFVKESNYVGNIGDKFNEKELTLVNEFGWETQFGYQTLYSFNDEDGNVLVWKTSGCISQGDRYIQNGDKVVLKGSIKDHSEYRGVRQTVLTRCKLVRFA